MADQSPAPGTISIADAATLLKIEARSVRRLASQGVFKPAVNGRYALVNLVQGYIDHLHQRAKGGTETAASIRMKDARAHDFEVRTARTAGQLVALDEAEAVQDELVQALRSGLNGLGASLTRDLELRRKIDDGVSDVFSRVYASVLEKAAAIAPGGEAAEADAPATPGRVGKSEHRLPAKRGRPRKA